MGYFLEVTCRQCEKTQTFQLGQGRRDNQLEAILPCFEQPEGKHIQKIMLSDDREKIWTFQRVLGICRVCGRLSQLPLFKADIVRNDCEICIIPKCQCGNKPEVILEPENESLTCPVCGHTLEAKVTGFWD